jgi:hypothetical protein
MARVTGAATTALVEPAPGATRALVMAGERVVAAEILRDDDPLPVGLVAPARLTARDRRRGTADMAGGQALVEPVPADWHIGQTRLAQVTRSARHDGSRAKQARITIHDGPAAPAPALADRLAAAGHVVVPVNARGPDRLGAAGWDAVVEDAISGLVDFPGGRLIMVPTPAMLVVDVDGDDDAGPLALAAASALADVVGRLGITGAVVVDFPTVSGRGARAAVDALLAARLPPPFEKTAMNGWGLVQIIRPRGRLSLLEQARVPGFAGLELLRRAMRMAGPVTLQAPPPVVDWLRQRPALCAQAEHLCGGRLALVADAVAGMGHVQPG